MYVLKGFASHALFVNNTPGQTNAIGEISTQSLTYAIEKGFYEQAAVPDISLISFLSAQDGTDVAIDPNVLTRTMAVIAWIYNNTINNAGQQYADQILLNLTSTFQTTQSQFASGAIVSDGTHYVPEWISFTDNALPGSFFKIWFCDSNFQSEYDEFQIVVIPPITPIDNFYQIASSVQTAVNARTMSQTLDLIQQTANSNPFTVQRSDSYNWVDPLNPNNLIPTNWICLVYGAAGNNIDSLKTALQNYIMANTTHTQAEWTAIFPDIFKRTEFTIVPNWGSYAIQNSSVDVGVYSPYANYTNAIALLTQYVDNVNYPSAHINAHVGGFSHPYRSVSISLLGSNQNRNNLYELNNVYPDYIAISSTSTDFQRMSQDTKGWALLLEQLLILAESINPYSSLPVGITKVTRNNKLYVVANYDNIQWLVVCKYNFL